MRRASRIALGFALASSAARAQDGALQRLDEVRAQGRYAEALELAGELEDPALAAEWRSYLLGLAGDLPGALRAARAGLEHAPAHAGLLTQALNAALTLGLAEGASELSPRLLAASGDDPALAQRARELAEWTRELSERQRLAERSVARARAVALAGAAGAALALAFLSRR